MCEYHALHVLFSAFQQVGDAEDKISFDVVSGHFLGLDKLHGQEGICEYDQSVRVGGYTQCKFYCLKFSMEVVL